MKILIVGSGGREHALAWKVAQSARCDRLYLLPGNAGTAVLGVNVLGKVDDIPGVLALVQKEGIEFVLVGPEVPLAAGLVDALQAAGVRAFGPVQAAARLESSKVFAKQFMARHHIPTADFASFRDFDAATAYLATINHPVVIKASGLAAGKGVILPADQVEARAVLHSILVDRQFGAAGDEVVIEDRLEGVEVSLMAFTDGSTVIPMLPVQDHKRLSDGDFGPNTGGMGAYAPVPFFTRELVLEVVQTILQPTVDGMKAEGSPYVGVLYAGLMLTQAGIKVLEFNCRFGDPETQVVMPLLRTDLVEIALECVEGRLAQLDIQWQPGAAACVVAAAAGYPASITTGEVVSGLDFAADHAVVFHAGTRQVDATIQTSGGRVLGVTGWGESVDAALKEAYGALAKISFAGMHYRRDIGHQARSAYAASGVSIDVGNQAVALMKSAVQATYSHEVLAGIGSFGGLFDAARLKAMRQPVLVASTDGVGTKVKLAAQVGSCQSIGQDLVNHCINDILVQGAQPLFFLDYFASAKLEPEQVAEVVTGVAQACQAAGMALLGGETAEMPGVYAPIEFDLAGTIIGMVERDAILPRAGIQPGDLLLGLVSSGPHTNGYSLIRKIFDGVPLDRIYPELGMSLKDALLAVHRSYLPVIRPVLSCPAIKGLAHLTGGGFIENIPRILPEGVGAEIKLNSWVVPALFNLIQQRGRIAAHEMYRVFNMGIGMVLVVDRQQVDAVQQALPEESFIIGQLVAGKQKVVLV